MVDNKEQLWKCGKCRKLTTPPAIPCPCSMGLDEIIEQKKKVKLGEVS